MVMVCYDTMFNLEYAKSKIHAIAELQSRAAYCVLT